MSSRRSSQTSPAVRSNFWPEGESGADEMNLVLQLTVAILGCYVYPRFWRRTPTTNDDGEGGSPVVVGRFIRGSRQSLRGEAFEGC